MAKKDDELMVKLVIGLFLLPGIILYLFVKLLIVLVSMIINRKQSYKNSETERKHDETRAKMKEIKRLKKPTYKVPYILTICCGSIILVIGTVLLYCSIFMEKTLYLQIGTVLICFSIILLLIRKAFVYSKKALEKKKQFVIQKSLLVKKIKELNAEYSKIQEKCLGEQYHYWCQTRGEFSAFDFNAFLRKTILQKEKMFAEYEENNEICEKKYREYVADYEKSIELIIKRNDCPKSITWERFKEFELEYYRNHKINFRGKEDLQVIAHYQVEIKRKFFSYSQVVSLINNIQPPIMTSKRRKEKEDEAFVKQNSKVLQGVKELNNKYIFHDAICKQHIIVKHCKTKREFDSCSYDSIAIESIRQEISFYEKFAEVYKADMETYERYCKDYAQLGELIAKEEDYDLQMPYEKFDVLEKQFYVKAKRKEPVEPSIRVIKTYTTPQGRNNYCDESIIMLGAIDSLIEEAKKPVLQTSARLSRAQLVKLQAQLEKKEQELVQREAEFALATKDHLYAPEVSKEKNKPLIADVETSEPITLYGQLKKLRQELSDGIITIEEYARKREAIL